MPERKNAVTMKGNPLTLVGPEIKEGDRIPDFRLVAPDLTETTSASFSGKPMLLLTVPSLDTDVCDIEARRFNEKAGNLTDPAHFVLVSMDLPFAQKRWTESKGVQNIATLSDYRDASFGKDFGVLIQELRLLARAVFVVDRDGLVTYRELVREITEEPDYDTAVKQLEALL